MKLSGIASIVLVLLPLSPYADDRPSVNPNTRHSGVVVDHSDKTRPSERKSDPPQAGSDSPIAIRSGVSACVGVDIGVKAVEFTCQAGPDDEVQLTEADILSAVRRLGVPRLEVQIQPGERTLVNARTIFYVDPRQWARSVTLLGFDVDLEATPTTYTWHHGDGTTKSTDRPGRPYPAFDVVHRYEKSADVVQPRVDVTYQVRYRIDGGGWQTLSQTLTAAGPTAELEVREAAPVLTKP